MAENDDVPFNRDFPLAPGVVDEVSPGVRRILCNNPSPFTFTGTVSYIVGQGKVAIIDPGPADEAHATALLDAGRRQRTCSPGTMSMCATPIRPTSEGCRWSTASP